MRRLYSLPLRSASMLAVAALLATGGCGTREAASACEAVVADEVWVPGGDHAEHNDSIRAKIARRGVAAKGSVSYAFEGDLDCDGRMDLVVQSLDSGQIFINFYISRGSPDEPLLRLRSHVDGRDVVVVLGPGSTAKGRDIALVGIDEGGLVPRLVRWRDLSGAELRIPAEYSLRMEERWSRDCRRANLPEVLDDGRIVLSRETIARSSVQGHGEDCALPRDTLIVREEMSDLVRER